MELQDMLVVKLEDFSGNKQLLKHFLHIFL